jgi:CRISPR/Cas system CSM-associated protein Csm2 small subunit
MEGRLSHNSINVLRIQAVSKKADYTFHPPSGSSVPGKEEANPYVFCPPAEIRRLLEVEKNVEELKKMKSALKQWERLYVYPVGYPYRKLSGLLRILAAKIKKISEVPWPSLNINYYQDAVVPEGYEGIIEEGLKNIHDNDDMPKFNLKRPGERPVRDNGVDEGDFLSPSEGVIPGGVVSPYGAGPDPEGLEYSDPPTGGETGGM